MIRVLRVVLGPLCCGIIPAIIFISLLFYIQYQAFGNYKGTSVEIHVSPAVSRRITFDSVNVMEVRLIVEKSKLLQLQENIVDALTPIQLAELKKAFAIADRDGNGVLDSSEVLEIITAISDEEPTAEEVQKIM